MGGSSNRAIEFLLGRNGPTSLKDFLGALDSFDRTVHWNSTRTLFVTPQNSTTKSPGLNPADCTHCSPLSIHCEAGIRWRPSTEPRVRFSLGSRAIRAPACSRFKSFRTSLARSVVVRPRSSPAAPILQSQGTRFCCLSGPVAWIPSSCFLRRHLFGSGTVALGRSVVQRSTKQRLRFDSMEVA